MPSLQLHRRTLAAGEALPAPGGPAAAYVLSGQLGPIDAGSAGLVEGAPQAAGPTEALVWSLVDEAAGDALLAAQVDAPGERQLRADRVDFPPGGVAYLHTHQGPGIRCLVEGRFAVETGGERIELEPLEAWFEAGPEPVYAEVRGDASAAFVRVMLLPLELGERPSIAYVRDEDRERPKSQRYTVFGNWPLGRIA